jgi:5'-3' exonuclease
MLVDSASLYFRAFHGVPDAATPAGAPVNALRGTLDMLARLVSQLHPTRVVACWDEEWRPGWRVDLLPSYKAHRMADPDHGDKRERIPERLLPQIPLIREALQLLGVPVVGAAAHEADDVIATLARRSGLPTDIVTGDRDLFQLVDDDRSIRVIYTARGTAPLDVVTATVVAERYGVAPAQYADFAVMRGDPSDGLPGVRGVGAKTAADLLSRHGDLPGIRAAARDGLLPKRLGGAFLAASDYLDVAPRVVALVDDLPLPAAPDRVIPVDPGSPAIVAFGRTWSVGSAVTRAAAALAQAAGAA